MSTSAGPTRVLLVSRSFEGGAGVGLRAIVRGLDRTRFEPVVLFQQARPEAGGLVDDCEVEVHHVGSPRSAPGDSAEGPTSGRPRPVTTLRNLRLARKMVLEEGPLAWRIRDLIRTEQIGLVHHNDNPRGMRAAVIGSKLAGVPQICHVRSYTRYSPWLDRHIARLPDAYIYVSEAVGAGMWRSLGIEPGPGYVLHNALSEKMLQPLPSRSEARLALGVSGSGPVVVNVGRLVAWKGQDVFLRSIASIRERFPGIAALVVGSPGPQPASRAYAAALRELAADRGIGDAVRFLGQRDDIPVILAAADVVVHSSLEPEAFGRVVIEGMVSGRPVVATAAGGPAEVIDEGVTGRLVPLGDPVAMAAAIGDLLDDPARASAMGARAREIALQRYQPGPYLNDLQQIYQEVLSGHLLEGTLPRSKAA